MSRICFFNTTKFWGGGEKWHYETAAYLASRGHHVLFVVHPGGEIHKRLAGSPVSVATMAVSNLSFLNPLKIQKIANLFHSERIQTVVFNGSSDVKLGAPAAKIAGVPARVYRRGVAAPVKNSFFNRFLYGRMITHFLTNSKATTHQLFQQLAVPHSPDKICTIYNGIDISHYTPILNISDRPAGTQLIIGSAGRLEAEKGHLQLLKVASLLKKQGLNFQMLIAGEGSQRQYLEKEIQSADLNDFVHLLGFVSDTAKFLQQLHLFLFPSKWEGFGYASAEAMATCLPVVAFDAFSNREVIDHEVTGFLVPVDDVTAFADKIMLLAKDSDLRLRMGRNGRARVCKLFNNSEQLLKLETFLCKEVFI